MTNIQHRMNRRHILLTAMGGATAVAVGGLRPAFAADGKVRVGQALARTGWAAAYDVPFSQGLNMAFEEVNAAGGIDGKYMIEVIEGSDAASSSVETIKSVDGLISTGVDVLFTSCDATSSTAAGRSGQESGVLMFAATSTQPDVPEKVGDWMYLSSFSDNISAGATGVFAAKDLGLKTAYLLKSADNTYTENVPEYFASTFEKYGGTIVGRGNFTFEQADFGGIIADIKALPTPPDCIMTAAFEPDLPAFLNQARAAGVTARIIGADGIDSPSFFALGALVEDIVVLSNRRPGHPEFDAIAERYGSVYPENLGNSAWIVGYDAGLALIASIQLGGATDSASIRKGVEMVKDLPVPNGTVTYAGQPRRPLVPIFFLQIKGGEGVFLQEAVIAAEDIPAPL